MFEVFVTRFEAIKTRSAIKYLSAAVAVWYFYRHFIKPFLSPLRKIPGRPYYPFVGNMLEALREGASNNSIRWMHMHHSPIIRFYFYGGEGAVLVGDPTMVKHILVSNSKNYLRAQNRFLGALVPGFLVLLNGEKHHALRRVVNPAFTHRAIEGYIPSFEALGRKLIGKWTDIVDSSGGSTMIDAQDYMTRVTMDAICECGFNYDMNSLDDDQSVEVKAFKHILGTLELSVLEIFNLGWLPTRRSRLLRSDMHIYRSCLTQVIDSKQEKMSEGATSKDILSQLFLAADDNGQRLTKENLYAQVGGFLIAGFETTSSSLTWTLLELAKRPEVQDKARQEVMRLLPDRNAPITSQLIENMKYLTAVIKESMRLNSPISTLFRRTLQADYLGKYYIPAGTLVGISMTALHRLPENWPDPLEFKPERFLEDYDKYAFLPFGAGPYMCIGNQFSLTESKITLALILLHFKFHLPPNYKFKIVRRVSIKPSPPMRLIVESL